MYKLRYKIFWIPVQTSNNQSNWIEIIGSVWVETRVNFLCTENFSSKPNCTETDYFILKINFIFYVGYYYYFYLFIISLKCLI